jgi:hypothetical protein
VTDAAPAPCRHCRYPRPWTRIDARGWQVECDCGATGPSERTEAYAVESWDLVMAQKPLEKAAGRN